MKLDNRGWGLRKMIIYSCAILCCLLIACYYVNYLYRDLQKSMERSQTESINEKNNNSKNTTNNKKEETPEIVFDISYYKELEKKLYNSTELFIKDGYVDTQQELSSVTSARLIKDGYLISLVDQKGNACTGYSNIFGNEDRDYVIKTYITCDDYSTED